ncbi:MAG: ATP-binding protein [Candidatus Aenigmatarchaeota archaeon]
MSDIYSRNILDVLKKWIDRREIFAIKGPRQAGKTTLMYLLVSYLKGRGVPEKNIVFLECDDFDVLEPFSKDFKTFVKSHIKGKEKHYFFLDEYQYIPDGGRILKILYDSFPNIKFIISGSSSLELASKTGKYLVGRVFYFTLYPFSFGEFVNAKDERLGKIYNERNRAVHNYMLKGGKFPAKDIFIRDLSKLFEEYIIFGGYPEVIKSNDLETKKTVLKNIYDTYITKDIVELLKISDTITFRNIVNILASQHSGLLNYDSIASDSKSYYRELKHFLSVLEETYVIKLLAPFHKNFSTELKKNPKSYFTDTGLRNYIIKNFNSIPFREDKGKLAEGVVLRELITLLEGEAEIKYWRTLGKAEVDFVVQFGSTILPVEVKYENFTKPKLGRSLTNFIHVYKPKRAVIITKDYLGRTKLNNTQIQFIPICYL